MSNSRLIVLLIADHSHFSVSSSRQNCSRRFQLLFPCTLRVQIYKSCYTYIKAGQWTGSLGICVNKVSGLKEMIQQYCDPKNNYSLLDR